MAFKPVEWVLAIFYGSSTHRATYGRLRGSKYTKDYIQLHRNESFVAELSDIFGLEGEGVVPITFKWPGGQSDGQLVGLSADRPHLKWETRDGAPLPWKMTSNPSESSIQTIPGNPDWEDENQADLERVRVSESGAGQPYLVAVKLKGESGVLHLRAYLDGCESHYSWASVDSLPDVVRNNVLLASERRSLSYVRLDSSGEFPDKDVVGFISHALDLTDSGEIFEVPEPLLARVSSYLRWRGVGVFFDPEMNRNCWAIPESIEGLSSDGCERILAKLLDVNAVGRQGDFIAEQLEIDTSLVNDFEDRIESGEYGVGDEFSSVKVRGSAQKVFSSRVRADYGYKCALTGVSTPQFLVASHIVPWSHDASIRLDPRNGICLSLLVDRAFEVGYIEILDDLTIRVCYDRIGDDSALVEYLQGFDGVRLRPPSKYPPYVDYLARRRAMFNGAPRAG